MTYERPAVFSNFTSSVSYTNYIGGSGDFQNGGGGPQFTWSSANGGQAVAPSGASFIGINTGFRTHKIQAKITVTNGMSIHCSNEGYYLNGLNGVRLDFITVGSNNYITLKISGSNITQNADTVLNYSAEIPCPAAITWGGVHEFDLVVGIYGWRVSYKDSTGTWTPLLDLPLTGVLTNWTGSSQACLRTRSTSSTSNTWTGIVATSDAAGATVQYIKTYIIGEQYNTLGGSVTMFSDTFSRVSTQDPYNPAGASTPTGTYVGVGPTAASSGSYYISSGRLFINATDYNNCYLLDTSSGFVNGYFPDPNNDFSLFMLKIGYYSGQFALRLNENNHIWFNSNISGTQAAVAYENVQIDSKSGARTSSYTNSTTTTINSGNFIYVVIVPSPINNSYPTITVSAWSIKVYITDGAKPTNATTATLSFSSPVSTLYPYVGLYTRAAYAQTQLTSLTFLCEDLAVFGHPNGTPYISYVPLPSTNALNSQPSTTTTELVGGVYLGTDYVYQATETT